MYFVVLFFKSSKNITFIIVEVYCSCILSKIKRVNVTVMCLVYVSKHIGPNGETCTDTNNVAAFIMCFYVVKIML